MRKCADEEVSDFIQQYMDLFLEIESDFPYIYRTVSMGYKMTLRLY